jgi:hypothetical protein
LSAFAAYGGQLWGARRWVDNPLMLTHLRWQGPAGQFLDAMRHSGDDPYLSPGERAAWVEIALHYPSSAAPMMSGTHGPWVALGLERSVAQALLAAMPRSPSSGMPSHWSTPFQPPLSPSVPAWQPPATSNPRAPTTPPSPPGFDLGWPGQLGGDSLGRSMPGAELPSGWPLSAPSQDFSVTPCVEIELPPTAGGGALEDYARDFTRDVAVHFARAARMLPQVRELRGWMHGDRLVLAARMVLGTGRPATQADMDNAAQLLADVLAQRALPYARLSFAEAAEWQAGWALPEP